PWSGAPEAVTSLWPLRAAVIGAWPAVDACTGSNAAAGLASQLRDPATSAPAPRSRFASTVCPPCSDCRRVSTTDGLGRRTSSPSEAAQHPRWVGGHVVGDAAGAAIGCRQRRVDLDVVV